MSAARFKAWNVADVSRSCFSMRETKHVRCHRDRAEMGSGCGGVAAKSGRADHVCRFALWPCCRFAGRYVPRRFGPRIGVAVSGSSGHEWRGYIDLSSLRTSGYVFVQKLRRSWVT